MELIKYNLLVTVPVQDVGQKFILQERRRSKFQPKYHTL